MDWWKEYAGKFDSEKRSSGHYREIGSTEESALDGVPKRYVVKRLETSRKGRNRRNFFVVGDGWSSVKYSTDTWGVHSFTNNEEIDSDNEIPQSF